MIFDFEPGDRVVNPSRKDWGIGQVQSIIKDKVTVNFENIGKKLDYFKKRGYEIISSSGKNITAKFLNKYIQKKNRKSGQVLFCQGRKEKRGDRLSSIIL